MQLKTLKNNKFFILTVIVFIVLVTFLDKNNLIDNWQMRGKIDKLGSQKNYYLEKIKEDSTMLENFKNDFYLEKFARESYYMKRKGETIYLVK